jgi:hypothetical protein
MPDVPLKGTPLTARLIEAFAISYLYKGFDDAKPTPDFHREGWALYSSDAVKACIIAPRGHAKSSAFTHVFMLATSLFRVESYSILVSTNEELAIEHLGDITRELMENDDLIEDFGIKQFITNSKTEIIVEFKDGHQFRILARGSGQKMRGRKWRGMRPGLIVCHEAGTPIFDYETSKWMKVEDHSTAKEWEAVCLQFTIAFNENDEHNEVVSEDHFYMIRETLESVPVWMRARDIRSGYFIGDVHDDGAEKRIHASVAGSSQTAIAGAEPDSQCNVSRASQGKHKGTEAAVGSGQSGERQGFQEVALREEQGLLRPEGQRVLAAEAGGEKCSRPQAPEHDQDGNPVMGEFAGYQAIAKDCQVDGADNGSYSPAPIENCVRPALPTEHSNYQPFGELKEVQHSVAGHAVIDGFVWRPIQQIQPVGRKSVVAIRTKSGFYKTKFGMSHNCDDL